MGYHNTVTQMCKLVQYALQIQVFSHKFMPGHQKNKILKLGFQFDIRLGYCLFQFGLHIKVEFT